MKIGLTDQSYYSIFHFLVRLFIRAVYYKSTTSLLFVVSVGILHDYITLVVTSYVRTAVQQNDVCNIKMRYKFVVSLIILCCCFKK